MCVCVCVSSPQLYLFDIFFFSVVVVLEGGRFIHYDVHFKPYTLFFFFRVEQPCVFFFFFEVFFVFSFFAFLFFFFLCVCVCV